MRMGRDARGCTTSEIQSSGRRRGRWMPKLSEVMRIKNVPVKVHWSVFLVITVLFFSGLHQPFLSLAAIFSYIGILLIHESGHMLAARKRGYEVLSIDIYPIFGLTHFQAPWSKFDECIIVWGGVGAQAIVAIPC